MRTVVLKRISTSDEGTFGRIEIGKESFYIGELPWRDNLPFFSCIPPGTYYCKFTSEYKKFGPCYALQNVMNRVAILMHSANYVGDKTKGFKCQVEGCLAYGTSLGTLDGQRAVMGSQNARARFEALMGREDFYLVIEDHVTGAQPFKEPETV